MNVGGELSDDLLIDAALFGVACVGRANPVQAALWPGLVANDAAAATRLARALLTNAALLERLVGEARSRSVALGHGHPAAFRSIKSLLRGRVLATMRATEAASIAEFVEIWYSEGTRKELQKIQIRR